MTDDRRRRATGLVAGIPAALLAAAGLWLATLAGAEDQPTVRQGVYGPSTCDTPNQTYDTKITEGPKRKTTKSKAKFAFEGFLCSTPDSDIEQDTLEFACRLDGAKAKGCKSPASYRGLKKGKHAFSVSASYAGGSPEVGDPTPATYKWKIVD